MKQLFLLLPLALLSCGEDRSGEQPFKPTVKTVGATVSGTQVTLTGAVLASPNSTLSACGFLYGTARDNLNSVATATTAETFSITVDTLTAGTYYYTATATNGLGRATGDTLSFTLP